MSSKIILAEILHQCRSNCYRVYDKLTPENALLRLNDNTASVGFIFRHTGETMHLLCTFLGYETQVKNTTMSFVDEGQGSNLEESKQLVESGFRLLENILESTPDEKWLETVDTPFFGSVSRVRVFSHVMLHNSYHLGQIGLTLRKGA
ncbi:MAG: DinB family protein [Bacteroidota bacterium]